MKGTAAILVAFLVTSAFAGFKSPYQPVRFFEDENRPVRISSQELSQGQPQASIVPPRTELTYEYKALLATSIPDVDSQAAYAVLKGQVTLQGFDNATVRMQVRDLKIGYANEDFDSEDVTKIIKKVNLMPIEPRDEVESPVDIEYANGKVQQIIADSRTSQKILNLKKAIISMLQVDSAAVRDAHPATSQLQAARGARDQYDAKLSLQSDAVSTGVDADLVYSNPTDGVAIFDTYEDTINGKAESRYIVERLPWNGNPNAHVMNITKIRDYENFEELPEWTFSTHVPVNCTACDSDNKTPINTVKVNQISIHGTPQQFVIERIESEAETTFSPLTTNNDNIRTNHSKILQLKHKSETQRPLRPPQNGKVHNTLQYRFPGQRVDDRVTPDELVLRPPQMLPLDGKSYPEKVVQLVKEIAEKIEQNRESQHGNPENPPLEVVPNLAYQAARAARTLSKAQIDRVAEEINSTSGPNASLQRKVLNDVLQIAGTQPALKAVIDKLAKREIQGVRAILALMALPFNAREITPALAREVKMLCSKYNPTQESQKYTTCWLAYAQMIGMVVDEDESKPTRPYIDETFTEAEKEEAINVLGQKLRSGKSFTQNIMLQGLALINHRQALKLVKPFAEGEEANSEGQQSLAVFALAEVAKSEPEEVSKIVAPIFFDVQNPTTVRIAALEVLMESESIDAGHFLEKLAALTWTEPNDQVQHYIYTTLDNLANSTHVCDKAAAAHAQHALQLAQPIDLGVVGSQAMVWSDEDENQAISTRLSLAHIANNNSAIPSVFYLELNNTASGFSYQPIEMSIYQQGIQQVLNNILGPAGAFASQSLEDILDHKIVDAPHGDPLIREALKLRTRRPQKVAVSGWVKLLSSQNLMVQADAKTILENLQRGPVAHAISQALSPNGLPIALEKIFSLGEVSHAFPSSLGIPIIAQVRSLAVVDSKTVLKATLSEMPSVSSPLRIPRKIKISVDTVNGIARGNVVSLGAAVPVNNKTFVGAGVISTAYASPSFKASVQLDADETKVTIKAQPTNIAGANSYSEAAARTGPTPAIGQIKLVGYKVKPFTTLYQYDSFRRIAESAKVVSPDDAKIEEHVIDIGRNLTGAPLLLKTKSDMYFNDMGSWIDEVQDQGVMAYLAASAVPQDFKFRKHQVLLQGAQQMQQLSLMIDIDQIETPLHKALQRGQPNDLTGTLGVALGWGSLPWSCAKSAQESQASSTQPNLTPAEVLREAESHPITSLDLEEIGHVSNLRPQRPSMQNNQEFGQLSGLRPQFNEEYFEDSDLQQLQPQFAPARNEYEQFAPQSNVGRGFTGQPLVRSTLSKRAVQPSETAKGLKVTLEAKINGPKQRAVRAELVMKRDIPSRKDSILLKIDVQNPPYTPQDNLKICAAGVAKHPKPVCKVRDALSQAIDLTMGSQLNIAWTESGNCDLIDPKVTIKAKFSKTRQQLEDEQEQDDWMYEQAKQDLQEGQKMSFAAEKVKTEVATMNKIVVDIQTMNVQLPAPLRNATFKLLEWAKSAYYNNLETSIANNERGKLVLKAVFNETKPTVTVSVKSPSRIDIFNDVYYPEISDIIRPPNAKESPLQQYLKELTADTVLPTCSVMGQNVSNFDNVTFSAPLSRNRHVLAKDCSPSDLFTVLMSKGPNPGTKELEVQLLKHKILIVPQGGPNSAQFTVFIDHQQTDLQNQEYVKVHSQDPKAGGKTIAILGVAGTQAYVLAPHHALRVLFDGQNANIQVSNTYRSDICGICGEFRGDTDYPFFGPKKCIYAESEDMVNAYAIQANQPLQPRRGGHVCPGDDNYPFPGTSAKGASFLDEDISMEDFEDSDVEMGNMVEEDRWDVPLHRRKQGSPYQNTPQFSSAHRFLEDVEEQQQQAGSQGFARRGNGGSASFRSWKSNSRQSPWKTYAESVTSDDDDDSNDDDYNDDYFQQQSNGYRNPKLSGLSAARATLAAVQQLSAQASSDPQPLPNKARYSPDSAGLEKEENERLKPLSWDNDEAQNPFPRYTPDILYALSNDWRNSKNVKYSTVIIPTSTPDDMPCFSSLPIPRCKAGTPTEITKTMVFACLPRDLQLTHSILEKVRSKPDFTLAPAVIELTPEVFVTVSYDVVMHSECNP